MFVIGLAGGSGSGKSTLAVHIQNFLEPRHCPILAQDCYYKTVSRDATTNGVTINDESAVDQTAGDQTAGGVAPFCINFDEPAAVDFQLLLQHLKQLRAGHEVHVPVYDFCTHRRLNSTRLLKLEGTHALGAPGAPNSGAGPVSPQSVLIVEGSMILSQPELRACLDVSVFIHASRSLRLKRRLKRDMQERGRSRDSVLYQFNHFTDPMHEKYVEPFRGMADWCVDGAGDFHATAQRIGSTYCKPLDNARGGVSY